MQKEFQLVVDIEKKILTPSFEVNTLDLKTIKLKIAITKGMSLVDLTDITVRMSIRKPDGNVIFQDCQVTNAKGGQVEIVLENQAYVLPGSYTAEIMCFKGADKVAVTGSFSYRSIRGIMDDKAVESKSEFTAITGMIKDTQETIEDLRKNGTGIDAQARQGVEQVSELLEDTATGIGVNIVDFPRLAIEIDDMPRFQRAIDFLSSRGGGRLVVPNFNTPYLFRCKSNPTINSPSRVTITRDNIEIIGIGKPLIEMKGLDINYLFSIDDYASSGRDVFSAFSFMGVKNCRITGIRFKGEYTTNRKFRYQSPRSIAVSFKGCSDCIAEDLYGEDILGNLVNVVHSYVNYDAPFANCYNIQINNSHAVHCLENGFNYMGGTFNSKVTGLSATRCANGMESASDGLTVNACIFRGNRSSGIGLSGKNQILNGVIGCESVVTNEQGIPENDAGYGLVVTGGEGVQINGGMYNDNRSFGIYLYPGVKRVYGSNIELKRNATNADNKVVIQMVGSPTKIIEDVQFTDCTIEGQGQVTLTIANYTKNVRLLYNHGIFEDPASSASFSANSVDSRAVGNKFNKPVTMNDPTGEEYNNGLYRNIDRTSIPTTGTWVLGDIINNRQRSPGGIAEWNCVQSGTFGTLNNGATTGTIEQDSKTLVVNNENGLYKGAFITIAGVSGVKRVVNVEGLNVTLDNPSNVSVTAAVISYRAPVIIPSRQNGVMGSISTTPAFVGQIAVTGGSSPKSYIAVGTSSATDWSQITN